MGGDDSQKLLPWRGMHSSPGHAKLRLKCRIKCSSKVSANGNSARLRPTKPLDLRVGLGCHTLCGSIENMAHADLDLLFDHLIKLAQKLLQENGGFPPLGAVVETEGQVRYVGAMNDEEYPGAQPLLDILTAEFRSMAASGAIRASGICFDVLVAPDSNAPKEMRSNAAWSTPTAKR